MSNKMVFTKARIEEAQRKAVRTGKRTKYRDEQTPGLLVDVKPSGNAKFWIRREVNKKEEWQPLGEFGDKPHELTVHQARELSYEILGMLKQGYSPQQVRAAKKAELTLRELFEHYIEDHAKEQRKTWQVMLQDFERNLGDRAHERGLENLAKRKVSDITFNDVRLMKKKLAGRFVVKKMRRGELVDVEEGGPYTANRTLQLLRAIFNRAIKSKMYIGDNPVVGIGLCKEEPRDRFLSREEIEQFIQALNSEPHEDTRHFIWLSLLSGQRKSVILSMEWDEINFEAGTWTIPKEKQKNNKAHVIRLTGQEIKLLKERENNQDGAKSDFVFPGEGRTGHLMDIKKSWTSMRKRAKLPDITIHDLRRNLGSWMASQNINVALIKGALNHLDMKTTLRVYAKTANDAERDGRLQAHAAMFEAAGDSGRELLKAANKEIAATKGGGIKGDRRRRRAR